MPGAGGTIAENYFYEKVKPDDLTLLLRAVFALREDRRCSGHPGVSHFVRVDAVPGGVKSPADLLQAKELRVGGFSPIQTLDIQTRLVLDLFGVDYRYIPGYCGNANIFAALQSGEVQYMGAGITPYKGQYQEAFIRTGKGIDLWHISLIGENGEPIRSPLYPSIPSLVEVYEKVHGKRPSGPKWEMFKWFAQLYLVDFVLWASKGLPREALADLRTGYARALADKEFLEKFVRAFSYQPIVRSGADGERLLKRLSNLDPAMIAAFKSYVEAIR